MAKPLRLEITNHLKVDKYFLKWNEEDKKARAKLGLQVLTWIVNGSPNSSRVPPVLTGMLRGSGSVFVGSKFVGATPKFKGEGEPNKSHSEVEGVITVGFNTPYAARWHEQQFTPGEVSAREGDVGYKYIEEHLKADAKAMTQFYANLMKRNVV
jgi:hypothetical protein